MIEEENKQEGEQDLEKNDCPLSPTDWVMFLSDEINRLNTFQYTYVIAILTVMYGLLGVMVGYMAAGFSLANIDIKIMSDISSSIKSFFYLIVCAAIILFIIKICVMWITGKGINHRYDIIEKIIAGETDSNKIREHWEKIPKILSRKRKRIPVA